MDSYPNLNLYNNSIRNHHTNLKQKNSNKRIIIIIIIIIIILIIGISLLIYFLTKKSAKEEDEQTNPSKESFIITENHRKRITLLQECMKVYGVDNYPILDEEKYENKIIINNKILSISTLEINIAKGETVELFKNGLELEDGEYACISYELNQKNYMVKIDNGLFSIPNDFNGEINDTPFTLILYFEYDISINEINSSRDLQSKDLDIYNNKKINNSKIILRKLNFFSKIKNFLYKNKEKIVELVLEKTVSYACVALIEYLFEEAYNDIIKGISQFACDELGEFVGEGVTKIIFNSESKSENDYQEIIYEESQEKNYKVYPRNIFSIPYINSKLEKILNQNHIEIKDEEYDKYSSFIIPSEESLTKHNHIFNPLGNLILADISSAYLKPVLLTEKYDPEIHFFKQYNFEWKYADDYDKYSDNIDINTFLVDDKYILFNNIDCNKTLSGYEFYTAIQKVGENKIKIYRNPEYIYLEKFSDFKAAFWIKDKKDISSCFHFNNIHNLIRSSYINDILKIYTYAYKKINMAEYDISNIKNFYEFITYTSIEEIEMPFYSNNDTRIDRFICNNYRLKNINWNEITISANRIYQFITYSRLESIDLDLNFLKNVTYTDNFFLYDDLTNNNIKNFDTSQITLFFAFLSNTMGDDIEFIKNFDTSQLIDIESFIQNNDIVKFDISTWDKNNLKFLVQSLRNCSSLNYIDLSGYLKVTNDCNFNRLFRYSYSIKAINIKGWDFSEAIIRTDKCFGIISDHSIFEETIGSSVIVYIDQNMFNNYLDIIKNFFKINNNNQLTTDPWPY